MQPARLTVDVPGDDAREIERLTRLLGTDLLALGLLSVRRDTAPAPADAKSAGQLTELVVSGVFSAGTLAAVTRVITAHIKRTSARSVTWEQDGKKIVLTGISAEDQKALAEAFAENEAKDDGGATG
ncbi:MAG: hypothetical protein ABW224_24230 [Kibdelosporangium sp.]